jgi:outer membrane protein TolC
MLQKLLLLCVLLALAGCTAQHYRRSADKEAAAVIAEKTPLVPNMDQKFTIATNGPPQLDGLPVSNIAEEAFGDQASVEVGAKVIALEKALDLAVKHSRTYQTRKESLYLQALSLTLARHRYTPIFSGGAKATHRTTHEIQSGVDAVTEERSVEVSGGAGMNMLLRTGGRLATSFSTDFLRFLTGDPRLATSSSLAATLTQPLLQGAGYKIATENLTQAERSLLYALRNFSRYRKEFSVDIASAYYGVLQSRDEVKNRWRGYQNFKINVAREKAFADEGQRPLAALGQLRQAELSNEGAWIDAVRRYFESLDSLKIQLGLPLSARIVLDDRDLAGLKIVHPTITTEEAITVALASRLDLQNQQDSLEDAGRHVLVAQNTLKPRLDLVAGVDVPAKGGSKYAPSFEEYSWHARLDGELPFDRKAERNSYRGALIAKEQSARDLDLARDTIRQQITEGWRALDQAKRTYEISVIGVKLSEQRVEEETLKQELGRGTARDLVDAQTDLTQSKNARTAALISHTLARLRFWRDMGILMIKDSGQWEELANGSLQ